jgi:predicted glycosyltransferase
LNNSKQQQKEVFLRAKNTKKEKAQKKLELIFYAKKYFGD